MTQKFTNLTRNLLNSLLIFCLLSQFSLCQYDGSLNLQQRCERYGFGYEEYDLTTEDGYILRIMRIPSGPNSPPAPNKPPMYFLHALGSDASGFTVNGPENSPAFYMANQGYDVWLANFRGTQPSRRHITLDPILDPEFWDFDLVSLRLDMMADIAFILEQTGFTTVNTFSYSLGATAHAFALAIEPDFFEPRIGVAVLCAGPISFANTNSPLYSTVGNFPFILDLLDSLNLDALIATNNPITQVLQFPCIVIPQFCDTILAFGMGMTNPATDDPNSMRNTFLSLNVGTSLRNIQHFVQSAGSGEVTYFDFGIQRNLEEYGTEQPPLIPLADTRNNVGMFYSRQDMGADPVDAQWYADIIGEEIVFYQNYDDISHIGFIAGDTQEYLEDLDNLYQAYPPLNN